ncbi:hypothetical protein FQN57_003298 [Myotisia sp. PD_48]|nr:hypothetical protein FQN57_003298 [Myotisia sp. PD_48]
MGRKEREMWTKKLAIITGTLSLVLSLGATAVNGVFASSLNRELSNLIALQCASAVSGSLSCVVLGFLILLQGKTGENLGTRLGKRWEKWMYFAIATLLCATAIVIAISLGWSYAGISVMRDRSQQKEAEKFFIIWCGLWATSSLFQACFYCLFLYLVRNAREKRLAAGLHDGVSRTLSDTERKEPRIRIKPDEKSSSNSSTSNADNVPSEPEKSLLQPMRTSFYARPDQVDSSPAVLVHRMSPEIERDNMTTTVMLKREPSDPFSDSKRVSFERRSPTPSFERPRVSVSMARHRSDGNIQHQWSRSSRAPRSRAQSPESFMNTIPETRELRSPSPSYARTNNPTPSVRRPRAVSESAAMQSDIHPLFRSDSPVAPPNTTPGTILTASPIAGQTVSMQTVQRIRSRASLSALHPRERSPLSGWDGDAGERGSNGSDEGVVIPRFVMGANARDSAIRYEQRRADS